MPQGNFKTFTCCICHKILDKKPIRLVKQLYDNKEVYGQYIKVHNYDFCPSCYKLFDDWVKKFEVK